MSVATIKLSETTKFIVDNRGKTVPTSDTGIPLIATNCIDNRNLYPVYEKLRYVSQDTYNNWFRSHPKPMDIILTLKGSQNGAVNLVPDPVDFCIAQDMVALRVDETKIDNLYLFAALRSEDIQDQIKTLDVSGVIPHFKKSDFDKLEIPLPPRSLQEFIGKTYFDLCNKIDLLHCQNKTLEAMAETLFRQWFIEEAKEDWEETPFTKWVYETKGGDWGKETPVDEFTQLVQCIRGTDIADLQNGLPKSTPLRYIKEKKFQSIKPEEGDIVFEISGGTETQSTGRCYFINEEIEQLFEHPLVFSNFCRLLKVRNPKYSYFVYLYLLYLYKADEFFALENGSSGIKNLNYKALLTELTYKMPPDDLVLKFHSKVSTYFSKVTKNKVQVQTLEKLRDTLLPKLMSGEVRVQYQTEEVA